MCGGFCRTVSPRSRVETRTKQAEPPQNTGFSTPAAYPRPAICADQAQVERAHVDQLPLQNVFVSAQMATPHRARLVAAVSYTHLIITLDLFTLTSSVEKQDRHNSYYFTKCATHINQDQHEVGIKRTLKTIRAYDCAKHVKQCQKPDGWVPPPTASIRIPDARRLPTHIGL